MKIVVSSDVGDLGANTVIIDKFQIVKLTDDDFRYSRMGLDPKVLLDVLNNSSARSWSTEVYCPVPGLVPTAPSSRNYDGGFKNELMVKVR